MARSRTLRCWAVAVLGLCLVATVAGASRALEHPVSEQTLPPASTTLSSASDAALVPARIADDVRVAAQTGGPLRILLLPAVLAAVLGLPTARRRPGSGPANDHRLLQTRRYVIALRAPPLQLA